MSAERTARICALNDLLRQQHMGGRIMISQGLTPMGRKWIGRALRAIAEFDRFTPGNDPYGERDFGSLTFESERLFWKIDYFDQTLTSQAADPSDASQCVRILTVMLAEEY